MYVPSQRRYRSGVRMGKRQSGGHMERATAYRVAALDVVQGGLTYARNEIRRQLTTGLVNPSAIETQREGGYQPTLIDTQMDDWIARRVASLTPQATYLSEETRRNIFPQQGDVYVWCDPLDGTTNAFTSLSAYAVVLMYDVFREGRFCNYAGAVACSHGEVVSWQKFGTSGEVWVDWPGDWTWPTRPRVTNGRSRNALRPEAEAPYSIQVGKKGADRVPHAGMPQRIAAVATSSRRRSTLASTFDLETETDNSESGEKLWLSTLGGNPLAASLLLGELGAVIEPSRVKLHDAAYLLPLTLAGGVVVDYNNVELNLETIFGEVAPQNRYVGPFVAAVDEAAITEVLDRLRIPGAGLDRQL